MAFAKYLVEQEMKESTIALLYFGSKQMSIGFKFFCVKNDLFYKYENDVQVC